MIDEYFRKEIENLIQWMNSIYCDIEDTDSESTNNCNLQIYEYNNYKLKVDYFIDNKITRYTLSYSNYAVISNMFFITSNIQSYKKSKLLFDESKKFNDNDDYIFNLSTVYNLDELHCIYFIYCLSKKLDIYDSHGIVLDDMLKFINMIIKEKK